MNKLYNDTAVQAIANAIRAKNGSSDTYTIAEMSTALNDFSYYAKPTISNVALATFEADGLPLNSLKVSVEAKQASGTPSPSNPLPISGWDAVVVTDTDDVDNPTVTQTTTISLGQTVYGGELDVVNGVMSLTHGYVDLGTLTWTYNTSSSLNPFFYAPIDGIKSYGAPYNVAINAISSLYKVVRRTQADFVDGCLCGDGTTTTILQIQVKDSRFSDATAFKTAMSGVQLVYELATPTTLATQPTPIKSLNGTNNLSVDCGEVIELEYFKEV